MAGQMEQKTIALLSNNQFYGLGLKNLVPDYQWQIITAQELEQDSWKSWLSEFDLVIVTQDFVTAEQMIKILKTLIENQTQVIYLAGNQDKLVPQLCSLGCQGIVVQELAVQQLLAAVKAVESRGIYYSQGLLSNSYMFLLGSLIELFEDLNSTTAKLTPREKEIFELYVQGESLVSIQNQLQIAKSTLNTHLESMRDKFGVDSNREIIAKYQIFQLQLQPQK
ncbi:MAG: LuxR C-terminal-related transcriptional regulator [Waterburya sp.]